MVVVVLLKILYLVIKMMSGGIFDDPFFMSHREHMRQMDQMFQMPFGFGSGGLLSLEGPGQRHQQHRNLVQRQQQQQQQLVTPDFFGLGSFGSMFQNMRRMMDDMHSTFEAGTSNPNGHVFTQSSFMSYSNVDGGQPKVFQASSSTAQGPGGVKEMRRTLRDSESGVEKIAVGHHLGERALVVEKRRNRRTGEQEENKDFINLDEEEGQDFDREWQRQARQMYGPGRLDFRQDRANRRHQALPAPSQRPNHHRNSSSRE